MTLTEAIALIKRATPANDPWDESDFLDALNAALSMDSALVVMANAVVSDDLVPRSELDRVTAERDDLRRSHVIAGQACVSIMRLEDRAEAAERLVCTLQAQLNRLMADNAQRPNAARST